jgi:uncharacterized protein YlxW (UPF0749 family)
VRLTDQWDRWRPHFGPFARGTRREPLTEPSVRARYASAPSRASRAGHESGGVALTVGRTGVVLAVVAFTLGLFIAAQLQSTQIQLVPSADAKAETAAITIKRLEQEQADLKKLIGETRARLAREQQLQASQRSALSQMNVELEREKLLAGLAPLKGRGVRIVLDDSATTKIPAKDDASLYIIHEYQLRDVVNLLWLSGAEAISINGERIVTSSSVYCVGSTILVNDTRLSPPYEILAIGDPTVLDSVLNDPGTLRSLRPRVKSYGLVFSMTQPKEVKVPAYNGILTVRHSSTVSSDSASGGQATTDASRQQ